MICRKPIGDAFWGPIAENPASSRAHVRGQPHLVRAGLAVLDEILERDLCGNARTQGQRLRQGFERLAKKYGVIGDIRGRDCCRDGFVRDLKTKERFPDGFGVKVGRRAQRTGSVPVRPHWIAFGPPLVTTAGRLMRWSSSRPQSEPGVECGLTAVRRTSFPGSACSSCPVSVWGRSGEQWWRDVLGCCERKPGISRRHT
jgi:hypothetical protein